MDNIFLEPACPAEVFTEKITEAAWKAILPYCGGKNSPKSSWFSEECTQTILDRKRAQRKYFKNPPPLNFISFQKAKAKCRLTIKQAKTSLSRNYVSKINIHTSIKSVWKKIRKIKSQENIPQVHLKKNTNFIFGSERTSKRPCRISCKKKSSSLNYSKSFLKIKKKNCKEQNLPNFSSDNSESYNQPFLLNDLKDALNKSIQTAAGPDGIYYQFLTQVPEDCLKILLQIFNTVWLSGKIPSLWKETIVVPRQNQTETFQTQPNLIAFTNCVCKTMERMVIGRLV